MGTRRPPCVSTCTCMCESVCVCVHVCVTHPLLHSWLLHDPDMELRSMYPRYVEAIQDYFRELFKILTPLQYSYGGPIIAFQIENEFAHHPSSTTSEALSYMKSLYTVKSGGGSIIHCFKLTVFIFKLKM